MFQGLFVDGFAGGGGASTGIARAIGRDVDIAINHDPMAIAVHKANHPSTEHHCQDIRMVWPTAATRLRPVAGAWFSPDCKEHSKAKGGPVKDRNIRQLPWEIVPWLKETRPTVGYVENVEEMQQWGPLDEQGHVIKALRGTEFKRWIRSIRSLGYRVDHRELRACDYGAPTSRKRLYIVMRCDKLKIVWPKPTHGGPDSPGVRSGRLLPYRTAAQCIDWNLPCPSIFDRKRPLKENTERRIAHGVMRYVVNAARPFIVPVTHSKGGNRAHDSVDPLRTITTANGGELAAVDATVAAVDTAFTASTAYTNTRTARVFNPDEPLRTATTQPDHAVAPATLAPFVGQHNFDRVGRPADEPITTITGRGTQQRLTVASMAPLQNGERRPGEKPREQDINAPVSTIATGGKHAVVGATLYRARNGERPGQEPRALDPDKPLGAVAAESSGFGVAVAHIERLNADSRPNPVDTPLNTVIAGAAMHAVVETSVAPLLVETAHGEVGSTGNRRGRGHRSVEEQMPTQTASNNVASVSAFLSRFHTSNTNGGRGDVEQPLGAVTAQGQHHAVIAAHMEQANTGMVGHDMRKPVSTIVGKGCTQRIVETTMIEEGALPPAMMEKAVKVAAFLIKYYGSGVAKSVDEPIDTLTVLPRYAVVTVTIDAVTYVIVDIGMRMLTPRELARAQGFPNSYILAPIAPRQVRGKIVHQPLTIAEQIRMIGNSVCPDVAAALVSANQPGIEMRMAA